MQYSQQIELAPSFPSFKRHRTAIDQSSFKVDLTLPRPLPPPGWASLPSPPMSGSPPSEHPPSPQQLAGRRRKRSDSIPPATSAPSSAPSTYQPPFPSYALPSQPGPPSYGGTHGATGPMQYAPAQHMAYAAGPSMGAPVPSPTTQHFPSGQLSPRTTRKNKAHVASACINCKKKHLRCDNARPCRRCVQSGKEDTCEDVVHKKRGRPPLRPEDPSARRSLDSSLLSDPARRMTTTDPASYARGGDAARSFRPLQAQPPYDPTRSQYYPPQRYSLYASPSIGPSTATATGQFYPPSSYAQNQPPYPPGSSARPLAPYPPPSPANYGYSNEPMRSQPQTGYSTALFPRTQYPPPAHAMPGPGGPSQSLQLPPIRPTSERTSIDPSLASAADTRTQQPPPEPARGGTGTTRQPDPKRPKMDIQGILGPKHD